MQEKELKNIDEEGQEALDAAKFTAELTANITEKVNVLKKQTEKLDEDALPKDIEPGLVDKVLSKKEEKAKLGTDTSGLLGDKRLPGEDFADYKERRKKEKQIRKNFMNKRNISWNSIFDGKFEKEKEKKSA